MLIHFELKPVHIIIAVSALCLGFIAGYLTALSFAQTPYYQPQNSRQEVSYQQNKSVQTKTAFPVSPKEERMIAQIATDLGLSSEQKIQITDIVQRNFPKIDRQNNSVDIAKVYRTIEEIKPLLSAEQSSKLDALVLQHVVSGQWK